MFLRFKVGCCVCWNYSPGTPEPGVGWVLRHFFHFQAQLLSSLLSPPLRAWQASRPPGSRSPRAATTRPSHSPPSAPPPSACSPSSSSARSPQASSGSQPSSSAPSPPVLEEEVELAHSDAFATPPTLVCTFSCNQTQNPAKRHPS